MVIVRLEKRRGKVVTLVEDLPMHPEGKVQVLKRLQAMCGAGGTMKLGVVELQGDHRERVDGELVKMGYKVRVR